MNIENLDATITRAIELRDRLRKNEGALIKLSMINSPFALSLEDRISGNACLTCLDVIEPYNECRVEFLEDFHRQLSEFIENENNKILTEIKSL